MEVHIATAEEIEELSKLSVSLGNKPFGKDAIVSFLRSGDVPIGFAAVAPQLHAAGSWVRADNRKQRLSYELRGCVDNELRRRGLSLYYAFPANDFEKHLFAKYGAVTEHLAQIRHL